MLLISLASSATDRSVAAYNNLLRSILPLAAAACLHNQLPRSLKMQDTIAARRVSFRLVQRTSRQVPRTDGLRQRTLPGGRLSLAGTTTTKQEEPQPAAPASPPPPSSPSSSSTDGTLRLPCCRLSRPGCASLLPLSAVQGGGVRERGPISMLLLSCCCWWAGAACVFALPPSRSLSGRVRCASRHIHPAPRWIFGPWHLPRPRSH